MTTHCLGNTGLTHGSLDSTLRAPFVEMMPLYDPTARTGRAFSCRKDILLGPLAIRLGILVCQSIG